MYNIKDISREQHLLETRIRYLEEDTDSKNFKSAVNNLLYTINNSPILKEMLKEYLLDVTRDIRDFFFKTIDCAQINLPNDVNLRIKVVLQFLKQVDQESLNFKFPQYLFKLYGYNCHIDACYKRFISQVLKPSLEDLLDKVRYHVEDNLANQTEIEKSSILIHIANNYGNISVGNNNNQSN